MRYAVITFAATSTHWRRSSTRPASDDRPTSSAPQLISAHALNSTRMVNHRPSVASFRRGAGRSRTSSQPSSATTVITDVTTTGSTATRVVPFPAADRVIQQSHKVRPWPGSEPDLAAFPAVNDGREQFGADPGVLRVAEPPAVGVLVVVVGHDGQVHGPVKQADVPAQAHVAAAHERDRREPGAQRLDLLVGNARPQGEQQNGLDQGFLLSSLSSRIGRSRTRIPVAWYTALAMAAAVPTMPTSPIPLAPAGPRSGSSSSIHTASMSCTSACAAMWYPARSWLG